MAVVPGFWVRLKDLGALIGAIRNIWWLLAATAAVGVAAWKLSTVVSTSIALASAITLFAFALGGALGTWLTRIHVGEQPYSWESAHFTYSFDEVDPLRHTQTTVVEIRARRNDVRFFLNRFSWTGSGNHKLSLKGDAHQLIFDRYRTPGWRSYYVLFDQPLRRNERATIELRHDMHDTSRTFLPVLSKVVSHPISHLTLRIVFPKVLRPNRITAAESRRARRAPHEWLTIRNLELSVQEASDSLCYVNWEVDSPVTGHDYRITWSWTSYPSE